MQLRNWLKQTPHPHKVRSVDAEGNEKVVRISDNKSRWRDAEMALEHAIRCEAVDQDGEVLRVWADPEAEEKTTTAQAQGGPSSLAEFARIFADGCDRAVERHSEFVRLGFEQQALLVRVMSDRLQALEKAWHKLLMSEEGRAAVEQDPNLAMIGALLGPALPGLLAGLQHQQSPQPPPNGAKHDRR